MPSPSVAVTTVTVGGMRCEHCRRAVFTALAGVPGIVAADVQLGVVTAEHDGAMTAQQVQEFHQALRDAIAVAGYTVHDCAESTARRPLPVVDG